MQISEAKWAAGKLELTTRDPEAMRFAIGFEPGEYQITKAKKKRSLDANAYAWTLISKLAETMRIGKEEIYRNAIRDIGGNYEVVCVKNEGLETLRRCWEKNGLGWQVETTPSKLDGCTNALLYYGSSSYDTHQMSVFIDRLIQDCKALNIETLPPEKLSGLLEAWE